jgi:hypothetical protein
VEVDLFEDVGPEVLAVPAGSHPSVFLPTGEVSECQLSGSWLHLGKKIHLTTTEPRVIQCLAFPRHSARVALAAVRVLR